MPASPAVPVVLADLAAVAVLKKRTTLPSNSFSKELTVDGRQQVSDQWE